MTKISVIILAYNTEDYIEECIESVLKQSFKEMEIICIDDGSTDNTGKLLDFYAERDERIKVIHQANMGIVESRKIGIRVAKGEYIAFVDSDDWIKENMYEVLYYYAKQYNADAVNCGYFSYKENSQITVLPEIRSGIYTRENDNCIDRILYDTQKSKKILCWAYWAYLFKREKIYKYIMKVSDIEQCEDVVGVWSFLANAEKIYVLNEAYYCYRVRNGSSCRKENPNYLFGINKAYNLLREEFEKKDTKEYLLHVLKCAMFDIIQSASCFTSERQDFFMFPYEKVPLNSKIVLYGAGLVGKSYYRQIKENNFCDIVLWVDKAYKSIARGKYVVSSPEQISQAEYDYVLIAILELSEAEKIAKDLVKQYEVLTDKIIIYAPKRLSRFVDLDDADERG